jgi:hypothetical protein
MHDQTIDTPRRPALGHHWFRSGLAIAPLMAALGFVLFMTLRSPLKDDIAWLLYVSQEWLAGRRLYIDLIEVNPPMIVWILALPAALSAVLGSPPNSSRCRSSRLACWVPPGGAPSY